MCDVELQIDSIAVVQSILGDTIGSASGWSLVAAIRRFMLSFKRIRVYHIYREGNVCVDAYIKNNLSKNTGIVWRRKKKKCKSKKGGKD